METADSLETTLDRDGYIILQETLNEQRLSEFRDSIRQVFALAANENEDIFQTCSRLDKEDKKRLHMISQIISKLDAFTVLETACFSFAKQLLPSGPLVLLVKSVLFGLPIDKRLVYNWHQESAYWPIENPVLNFHFPVFEKADQQNGTMSVLVGSHKQGRLPYIKSKKSSDAYMNLTPENIEELENQCLEERFDMELGDLGILHHDLLHRSNFNSTPRTRFSAVVRIGSLSQMPPKMFFTSEDF